MFRTARAAVYLVSLGLLLGGVLFGATPASAGVLDASWTAPTTNTDGSPLTDLASYRVYYGSSQPCPGASFSEVASPTPNPPANQTVSLRLMGLSKGASYNVAITAVDGNNNESGCSTVASAVARIAYSVAPTTTVNFGTVAVGSSADQAFTVSNSAGGTVSGTVSTSAPFSIVSGGSFSLAGLGASQTVTVRFRPTTAATASVNINFAADGDTTSRLATGTGSGGADTTPPTVTITTPTANPTFATSGSPLTLGGTAADDIGVTQVAWANSRGGSGTATGTTSWTASGIALQTGSNVLTITARDAAGNTTTDTVTVTFTDTTTPTVTITTPTANPTFATGNAALTLGGTAADNVGVTQVTWTNSLGGSGTATGTTSWTVSGIALQLGANVLTVTARDAAGNTATDTVTVTRSDTTPPTATITAPTSNPTYTTSSSFLTLGGTAADNVGVTQVTWVNNRGGSGGATGTTSWTVAGIVLQSGANVLTVSVRDAAGNTATAGMTVILSGTFTFTDDPLAVQTTPDRAVHIMELRAAIDSVRVARGLGTFGWTDPTLTPGSTPVKALHVTELRTALNQAYQAAGRAVPTYTDPSVVAGAVVIKALHLSELRAAARAL